MAVGGIDLSKVNISLAEFQKMSDGKYNAGEVKLSSETRLQKVNNHIHRLSANKTEITHEEVLAIKEAFVKALSSGGVADKKEINRIRSELGLSSDTHVDMQLRRRSLTPLTRQQIRDIIDRNAVALGAAVQDGTIRTSDQLYGGLSDKEKARRAEKREEAATARFNNAEVNENREITLFQELIGGTADFQSAKNRATLLGIARGQAENVMKACNGNPSDTRKCTLSFTTQSGAKFEMPTDFTEKQFLEMIENTCMRLAYTGVPEKKTLKARNEFQDLSDIELKEYFRAMTNDAEGRFKARTAIVAILQARGIDDCETFSIVNKLPIHGIKLMADSLLTSLKDVSGDSLRSSQFMRLIVSSYGSAREVQLGEQAFIPALSVAEYNKGVMDAIALNNNKLPPGVRSLMEQLRADMHARFGDAVPANKKLSGLADDMDVLRFCNALAEEGKLATADNIRDLLAEAILKNSVASCISMAAPRFLGKSGGGTPMQFTRLAKKVCPDLVAELRTAKNPEEVSAAIDRHSEKLARIAERMAPCKRNTKEIDELYREALAKELGMSADSEMFKRVATIHVELAAEDLSDRICSGELDVKTGEEIDEAFKQVAADLARARADLLRKADSIGLSPFAAKTMKGHIMVLGKTNKFNFDKFIAEAAKMKPLAEKVNQLIDSKASVDEICNAIGDIFLACKEKVRDLLHKKGQLDDIGPDDFASYGVPMQILAMDSVPGLIDKAQAFFNRDDVKALDFYDENGVAARAKSLHDAINRVEKFAM